MTKRNAIIAAIIIGILAVAVPIITTLYLARQESIHSQMATVGSAATDVLRRADETGDQGGHAIASLNATHSTAPCSTAQVQRMGSLAIASDELQGVGYVFNNQLVCSSLGAYGTLLPIGPVDYTSSVGIFIRRRVKFPLVNDTHFDILTKGSNGNGYSFIVHPQLILDVTLPSPNISLGLFTYSRQRLMAVQGEYNLQWGNNLGNTYQKDFVDGNYLVSLRRSHRYDILAFAAIPISSVDPILRRQAETLVPIGIFAGFALALAVLYLARIQLALPAVLKVALRRKEFFVVYQPVVDLRTRQWVGAEVLLRWRRPNGELIRPDLFIPVAEDSGLIQRITEQVFEMVGHEAASIFERHPNFHLSINLAAADLASRDTVKRMVTLLGVTQARNGNLIVEVTERGLVKTSVAQELLRDLRSRGVRVAIDDFGTGYSSLSYLQTFPIDILKIDKSFIETIGIDSATSQVIYHIIEMAKGLKLRMIAEGVETEAQAKVLRDQGVEFAQGWLFAKPMPLADLVAQLGKSH